MSQSFKDLIAWQKSADFTVDIYKISKSWKDYSFRDQFQRAALSVTNNIAEGYAKRSDKALKNFLYISKGSAAEVESMLIIAERLEYINDKQRIGLQENIQEIARLLSGLIKKL